MVIEENSLILKIGITMKSFESSLINKKHYKFS